MKKLRQGQTVYVVRVDTVQFPTPYVFMYTHFLYSQNEPLPEQGLVIDKMPVTMMREIVKNWPQDYYTHSRRKALTRFKQLSHTHNTHT